MSTRQDLNSSDNSPSEVIEEEEETMLSSAIEPRIPRCTICFNIHSLAVCTPSDVTKQRPTIPKRSTDRCDGLCYVPAQYQVASRIYDWTTMQWTSMILHCKCTHRIPNFLVAAWAQISSWLVPCNYKEIRNAEQTSLKCGLLWCWVTVACFYSFSGSHS